jgi:parallel beta-helix repeat protein
MKQNLIGKTKGPALKLALGIVCNILAVTCAVAATYPNGTYKYAAPTLPAYPTGTPGTKYTPATMDDVGILNAINAARANGGGQITLSAGTYTINKRVALQSNISIIGQGQGTTIIKRGSGFAYSTTGWTELIGAVDAVLHDFWIQGVTYDGGLTYSQQTGANPPLIYSMRISSSVDDAAHLNQRIYYYQIEVRNCTIGLNMGNSAEITFDNNYFHNNGGPANFQNIYIRNIKDVLVKNNDISFSYEGGGLKVAGGQNNYPNESKNVTIINNYFHSNGWGDCGVSGMQNVRIANNTCTYAAYGSTAVNNLALVQGGIVLSYENSTTNSGYNWNSNVDVVNNIVQNNNYAGIELTYSNGLNVQGNRCSGTTNGNNYNGPYSVTSLNCDYNTL